MSRRSKSYDRILDDGKTLIIIVDLPVFPQGSCEADAGLLADGIVSETRDSMPMYWQDQKKSIREAD